VAAGTGPFDVEHTDTGGGCTMPLADKAGVFQAPLDSDSAYALGVRQHEYGHLGLLQHALVPDADAMTAIRRQGIHDAWLQSVLDVVVNAYMLERGNREISCLVPWSDELPTLLPRWVAATLFLRCHSLPDEARLRLAVAGRGALLAQECRHLHRVGCDLWRQGVRAQRVTEEALLALARSLQETFGPDSGEEDPSVVAALRTPSRAAAPAGSQGRWGAMEVVPVPLAMPSSGRRPGRAKVPSRVGAFRYPHRALLPGSDGCAFSNRRAGRQNTVLIDCSGSMTLSAEDMRGLLERAKGAAVAGYAGLPSDNSRGRLLILARNGRVADAECVARLLGSGNVVDGPALQWLGRQPGNRVWISDGGVTGVGDTRSPNLDEDARHLVRNGRIRVCRTLEAYIDESE
jgi:hypothetical protein